MKFPKTINLGFPLLFFIVLLFLMLTDIFYVDEIAPATTLDRIFYLIIHISFWLSTAFLFNSIVNKFVWGGVSKIPVGNIVFQKVKDFVAVLCYAIIAVVILINYFAFEFTFNLVAVAFIFSIFGTFIRPYFLCFLRSVFRSNSVAFNIGDWINLSAINSDSEIIGEVIDIDRKNLKIKSENNNIITISQASLNDFVIENYWGSGKESRFEVNLRIDFTVSTNRVKRILQSAAKQAIEEYSFLSFPAPEVFIKSITESGIEYAIYFWIVPWEEISPEDAKDKIIATVLQYLSKSGLSLSYPKEDVYVSQMPERQTKISLRSDVKKIISSIDLFNSFHESELEDVSNNLIEHELNANTIVIKEGNEGDSMFVVIEGLLDVFVNSKDGHHIKVGRLTPGDFFGEMSLMTGDKRSATVTAATDVLLFEITKESISKIIAARESVIIDFGEIITRRSEVNIQFKESYEKNKQNLLNDIVGKIKKFFKSS